MNLKPSRVIKNLDPELALAVLAHPAHRANIARVGTLIEWLRTCKEPCDYYEFQRYLCGELYSVEERRAQCSHNIKRLRAGKAPVDYPPPPDGDASERKSWEFEAYVYERLARQLRSVGDGLAWRCFGYDRRIILTLARNESPGPMFGKEGLPYELGRVKELWDEKRHFVLLHDLTNCLRIADLTEFTADGGALFREIKRKPRDDKKQMERIETAVNAIMHGSSLPSGHPDARLVEVTEPYVTNFKQLGDIIHLAKQYGSRGMRLSQGRALVATSIMAAGKRWKNNHDEGLRVSDSVRQRAIKRAGMANASQHLNGFSGDTAARSPIMAPWSIYPLAPVDCAEIICDILGFESIVSVDALADSLGRAGLRAEVLLQPASGEISGDQGVLRAHWGNRAVTLHAGGLNLLLYELVEPDTWARALREILAMPNPPTEPALVFTNEGDVWV